MIEAISVNLSQAKGILELDCDAFAKLDGLKFLEFCNGASRESEVRIRGERIECLPEELRYMRWDKFPAKSLPSNFCAENLVELHMQYSKIERLWTGKQRIGNLKVINLYSAEHLVELPDISEGRNIQNLHLSLCKSLVKVPSSVQYLPKLEDLRVVGCGSCASVPTMLDSEELRVLLLSNCPGINMFPQLVSGNNIIELHLDETKIIEVPSSIESLKLLEYLSMRRCQKLSIISTNIYKLKSLHGLDLSGCTNLQSIPEFMEPMKCQANIRNLEAIFVDGSGIEDLLPALENSNQSEIEWESLPECTDQLCGVGLHIFLSGCEGLRALPESIVNLCKLRALHLGYCDSLRSLPANMERSQLKDLNVEYCFNLSFLPKLPSSLENLNARSCFSLETISPDWLSESGIRFLNLANCLELDEEECREILDIVYSNFQYNLQGIDDPFEIMLPWSEIPEWISSQTVGSSLTLKLPPSKTKCHRDEHELYTFAFCVILKPICDSTFYTVRCSVKANNHVFLLSEIELEDSFIDYDIDTEHLLLWNLSDIEKVNELSKYFGREVSLEFGDEREVLEVTKCGVLIV